MVQRNPDLLKNTLENHPEKIPIEEVTTQGYFLDQIDPIKEEKSKETLNDSKSTSNIHNQFLKRDGSLNAN